MTCIFAVQIETIVPYACWLGQAANNGKRGRVVERTSSELLALAQTAQRLGEHAYFCVDNPRPDQLSALEREMMRQLRGPVLGLCAECRFWLETDGAPDLGTCRRSPPTGMGWPGTLMQDWCGEWRPT